MTQSTPRSASWFPLPAPKERRRLREAHAMSEEQVAAAIGVTRATVRSWETGRTTPRGRTREAYAKLLAGLRAEAAAVRDDSAAPAAESVREAVAAPAAEPPQAAPSETAHRTRAAEPEQDASPEPGPPQPPRPTGRTPAEAFDALYTHAAPALVRQAYLLTGRRRLSQESVERAFQLAWQRWPEVAVDQDPTGWVRAAAYEYAMSPWQRLRPAHRHPDEPPPEPARRELLETLHELPPPYLRTLLLYDGVGLDLPETAAETEASTPATANRVLHARAAVAERLPALDDVAVLQDALKALTADVPVPDMTPATTVRTACERQAELWTRIVVIATTLIVLATALTLFTAPTRYEPPMPPTQQVEGVPAPHSGPQLLTPQDMVLRDKLSADPAAGPERLLPLLG